jgi:hypothetical protein
LLVHWAIKKGECSLSVPALDSAPARFLLLQPKFSVRPFIDAICEMRKISADSKAIENLSPHSESKKSFQDWHIMCNQLDENKANGWNQFNFFFLSFIEWGGERLVALLASPSAGR